MLLRTVIISAFGANATNPRQAAVYKLGFSFFAAAVLGFCAREFIRTMGISGDLPSSVVRALMTVFGFLITGLVLFSFGASGIVGLQSNDALKVLASLPISRSKRFVLHNISALLLAAAGYVFLVPAALYIATITSVSSWHVLLMMAFGCLSCLALMTASYTHIFLLKFASFCLVVYGMGRIINRVFTAEADLAMLNYVYLLCGVCIAIAILSAVFLQRYEYRARLPVVWLQWPRRYVVHFWFALKFMRNKKSQTSFLFSLTVLCLGALFLRNNPASIAVEDWLRLIAFMTMAVFCDARITYIKYRPLEANLDGTAHLVRAELQSLRLLAMMIGLPLLVVLLAPTTMVLGVLTSYVALQSLATAIGVLSGSIFASTPDNTGGQLLSVIFGGCLLYLCLSVAGKYLDANLQAVFYMVLAIILGGVVRILETKRQRSYGYVR